ncbi:Ger(x)C family spore germination protein [Bacillus sp. 165]|uniref:Ger(x)C family spore germination protein n=1 Tax=Bacillus sp. 165 TaxID=1529117 RepID=UPI001ADC114A|nr:Ger(x)C family spore germination protein [Bacillus sp. 165]MBO9129841.1 Ger(x)C family spore germination protein [Bacillus sp. 165]
MKQFIFLICLLIIQTGCSESVKTPYIEDKGLITHLAVDTNNKGGVTVTAAVPVASQYSKKNVNFYSASGKRFRGALIKLSSFSDKYLEVSQLQSVIISEAFAKKYGVQQVIQKLYNSPKASDNIKLAITKGPAQKILKGKYEGMPLIIPYIATVLTPKQSNLFSSFATFRSFILYATSATRDPAIPYLEEQNNHLTITGNVMFKHFKYIRKLGPEESSVVAVIFGKKKFVNVLDIAVKENNKKYSLTINDAQKKLRLKVIEDSTAPLVNIDLHLKIFAVTYEGTFNIENPKNIKKAEQVIAKALKNAVYEELLTLQNENVDLLGLGEEFRKKTRGKWTQKKWEEIYPKIKFKVHVTTKLLDNAVQIQ